MKSSLVAPAPLQRESQPPPRRGGWCWFVGENPDPIQHLRGVGWRRPAAASSLVSAPTAPDVSDSRCTVPHSSGQRFPPLQRIPTRAPWGVSSSRPNGARMPVAFGLECFPRFLVYRRSYRLLRHPCGMTADVGWRWIGRAFASRLLMRVGGGTVLWVPPAATAARLQCRTGVGVPTSFAIAGGAP